MTAPATPTADAMAGSTAAVSGRTSATGPILRSLAVRGLVRMSRLPSLVIPAVVMPLFFLVAFTGSFDGLTRVEGYGADNVVDWVTAWSILQAASFAGVGAAGAISTDIETGFLDRLLVAPTRRWVLVAGPLTYAIIRALVATSLVLLVAKAFGAQYRGGALGILLALVGAAGVATVIGLMGIIIMLKLRDAQALALVQLIIFCATFLSIGQVPLDFMTGWLHDVARVNPVTNILRLIRQGFLGSVDWSITWPGLLALGGLIAVFGSIAIAMMSRFET